jgi:hypothetical protein
MLNSKSLACVDRIRGGHGFHLGGKAGAKLGGTPAGQTA